MASDDFGMDTIRPLTQHSNAQRFVTIVEIIPTYPTQRPIIEVLVTQVFVPRREQKPGDLVFDLVLNP